MLKVTNTLTGKKETFEPLTSGHIQMYVCGPTVYDDIHIGNARSAVNFDTIRKYLIYSGFSVKYVMNITDIDDKIIKKAIDEKKDFHEIADTYTQAYLEVMKKLGVQPPDVQPKATDSIPEMIELITGLVDSGHAYVSGGDVLYDSKSFKTYGKLSGKNLEELIEGIRVEKNDTKKNPTDFVLWKTAKPGEPSWDSPWGKGRPGWHIECSAMVRKHLGDSIDIHGGGVDLIFPHHENEIAQCEAFTQKPYVKYWLHNGFIEISGQKMSKSLGNIWKTKDALADFRPEVLRYFFLSAHYRSGLNYDRPILESADRGWKDFHQTFKMADDKIEGPDGVEQMDLLELRLGIDDLEEKFKEAMDDDFNTPKALAVLFDFARLIRQVTSQRERPTPGAKDLLGEAIERLKIFGGILGIVQKEKPVIPTKIDEWSKEREDLKKTNNYEAADQKRNQIIASGYLLADSKMGTSAIFPYEQIRFKQDEDKYLNYGWVIPSGLPNQNSYLFTENGIQNIDEMKINLDTNASTWLKDKGFLD
jgi:cysteinyl-tRNA synthetase